MKNIGSQPCCNFKPVFKGKNNHRKEVEFFG